MQTLRVGQLVRGGRLGALLAPLRPSLLAPLPFASVAAEGGARAASAGGASASPPPPPPAGGRRRQTPQTLDGQWFHAHPKDVPAATLSRVRGMFYDARVRLSRRQQSVFARPSDTPLAAPLADHGFLYGLRDVDMEGVSDAVRRALSTRTANNAGARRFRNAAIVRQFAASPFDTGSPRVQVSMLTSRITLLTLHLSKNRHDQTCKRRLQILASRRRRLLQYMVRTDYANYRTVVRDLALRPVPIVGSRHPPKVRKESHAKINARSATKRHGGSRGHLGH